MRFKKIYIEITNVCNLDCSFCIGNVRENKFITLQEFSFILDQIRPYTRYIYLHVLGEPLLHPQLCEILRLAHEKNFYVNITTNGTLLKRNKEKLIQAEALRQVNISLHSFPHHPHYLEEVTEVGDALSKRVYISYRLWTMNGELNQNMKDTLAFLENHYHCSITSYTDSIKLADRRFLSFDTEFEWPSLAHPFVSERGTCQGIKKMCAILSDGRVVPCCLDSRGEASFGNIFVDSFSEILDRSEKILANMRNRRLSLELCQHCSYHQRFEK